MTHVKDLSVAAAQGPALAKQVFNREGILIVKDLLPHRVDSVTGFLRGALTEVEAALRITSHLG